MSSPAFSKSRAAVVAIVIVALALSLAAPVAVAQDANSTSTNASGDERDLVAQVDEDVDVESYTYDEENETFAITFSSSGDEPSDVTVTEVISQREGSSGSFGVEQFEIEPDETVTIEVSAKFKRGTAAVMIVTQKSLDKGTGTFLQYDSGGSWLHGSPTWTLIRISALGGIAGVVVLIVLISWHKVADRNDAIEVRT